MNEPPFRGRPTPPALWLWGAPAPVSQPRHPVRIGDAERDAAVAALGDHFAAGRLTREELDERIDQAMVARFNSDLEPLFDDLPRSVPPPSTAPRPRPALVRTGPPLPVLLLPLLLLVLVAVPAVAFHAPWLIWGFFWVAMFTGFWGRRHRHRYGPR